MSASDDEFLRELLEAFYTEAAEHLQALAAGLLDLEMSQAADQRQAVVEMIYREAHSLKGAARAVNMTDIEAVCQSLETVFSAWKRQILTPNADAFDAMQDALDAIETLLAAARDNRPVPDRRPITQITQRLSQLLTQSHGSAVATVAEPAEAITAAAEERPRDDAAPSPGKAAPAETVRISTAKLEAILRQVEELLVVKQAAGMLANQLHQSQMFLDRWSREWAQISPDTRLLEFLEEGRAIVKTLSSRSSALAKAAAQDYREIGTKVDRLLEDSKKLLMLPFSTLLVSFPKMVRDLARDENKEVQFVIQGGDVEIDKRILEEIKDPLTHLLRNSVGHGIEMPDERERQGKPPRATIAVAVSQSGGSEVCIAITDDGGGINVAQVKASAIQHGLVSPEEAARMDDAQAARLIFQSEVSTSPIITELSGRGLGMAIVREKVEKLGGRIELTTVPHQGTTFDITLPLTLATFKGIVVRAAEQLFVLPTAEVERVLHLRPTDMEMIENRPAMLVQDRLVPVVGLEDILGLTRSRSPERVGEPVPAVIIGAAERRVALRVAEIVDEQEVLVKALRKPLVRVRHVSGTTILGSGKPVPILNVGDLVLSAAHAGSSATPAAPAEKAEARKSLLVAEDSITSRMLLKNILETAGYRVTTAVDGADALAVLHGGQEFALVVSDVDMPHLSGFDLTAQIRADPNLAALPVVLVTARDSREDRERGVEAGASAYLVKSSFDQSNLLATVRELI